MATDTAYMTQGNLPKQILRFSAPLMLSNVLQVLFNMSDIAVVGQFAGAEALGAVGSTATLVFLFTGFLIGIGNGINARTAMYLGSRSDRDTEETVHTSCILSALIGVLLLIIGVVFARPLLELLNTKDVLIDGACLYLRIYFLGMPALALYNFGNAVFSAAGNTKKPLVYLLVAGVINVLLNLLFVIVCGLGVAGVAIASAVSQYVSAILIISALLRTDESYRLRFSKLRLYRDKSRSVLSLGVPAGLQNSIFAIANLFIQSGVNSFDAVVVEGNSAAANADSLVYDVMAAFYIACSSFMGQNYGAGKRDRVLKSYGVCLFYSFAIGAILGLSVAFFGESFLSVFSSDREVIEAGMIRLKIMGFCYAFSAFMDCTIAASRGLGKSAIPMVLVFLGSCVFRIAWVYTVFAHFKTLESLYLLFIFSWVITAIAEMLYFFLAAVKKQLPKTRECAA